jgi:hypothetical protein
MYITDQYRKAGGHIITTLPVNLNPMRWCKVSWRDTWLRYKIFKYQMVCHGIEARARRDQCSEMTKCYSSHHPGRAKVVGTGWPYIDNTVVINTRDYETSSNRFDFDSNFRRKNPHVSITCSWTPSWLMMIILAALTVFIIIIYCNCKWVLPHGSGTTIWHNAQIMHIIQHNTLHSNKTKQTIKDTIHN